MLTTKFIFILSSISTGFGFWLANHTSINEKSAIIVFKIIKFFGEMSNN